MLDFQAEARESMRMRLGEILIERGVLDETGLAQALEAQRTSGRRIGSTLVEMGVASSEDVLDALSEQLGVPAVDLGFACIPSNLLACVPEPLARRLRCVAFGRFEDHVQVAMVDPLDERARSSLEDATASAVDPHVALEMDVSRALDGAYASLGQRASQWVGWWLGEGSTESQEEGSVVAVPWADAPAAPREDSGLIVFEMVDERSGASAIPVAPPVAPVVAPGPRRTATPRAIAKAPAVAGAQGTVLLVDSSDDDRRATADALTRAGLAVREARDAIEALAALRQAPADVLVLEPSLRGMHGFDLCRQLREQPETSALPVVVTRGRGRDWRLAADLRALYGVARCVDKACEPDSLLAAVRAALHPQPQGVALPPEIEELRRVARADQKAGRLPMAVAKLREAVARVRASSELRRELATLLVRTGAAYEAIHELEEAVELEEAPAAALRMLANLYEDRGFRLRAAEAWQRLLACVDSETERSEIRAKVSELL